KVDLSALPSPRKPKRGKFKTDNPIEQKILTIWQNVLKHEQIGLDDNFFDVGGTSLHITEIYYQLVSTFKLKQLSMVDLFQYTTIRQLTEYINKLEQPSRTNQPSKQVA